jgi:GNAT superfamily N-acetyltransferase
MKIARKSSIENNTRPKRQKRMATPPNCWNVCVPVDGDIEGMIDCACDGKDSKEIADAVWFAAHATEMMERTRDVPELTEMFSEVENLVRKTLLRIVPDDAGLELVEHLISGTSRCNVSAKGVDLGGWFVAKRKETGTVDGVLITKADKTVDRLYVRESIRRRGIGTLLIEWWRHQGKCAAGTVIVGTIADTDAARCFWSSIRDINILRL